MTSNIKIKFAIAFFTAALMMVGLSSLSAQSKIVGTWKTVDDDGETVKSLLKITEGTDGKLYGTVTKIFPKPDEDQDPKCTKCSSKDSRHNQRVMGMTVLRELSKENDTKYGDGKILDPENGKEYDCYVELVESNKLKVRGFLGGWTALGRTQYWYRQ